MFRARGGRFALQRFLGRHHLQKRLTNVAEIHDVKGRHKRRLLKPRFRLRRLKKTPNEQSQQQGRRAPPVAGQTQLRQKLSHFTKNSRRRTAQSTRMTLPTTALLEGSKAEMCERQLGRSGQLGSAPTQSGRSFGECDDDNRERWDWGLNLVQTSLE